MISQGRSYNRYFLDLHSQAHSNLEDILRTSLSLQITTYIRIVGSGYHLFKHFILAEGVWIRKTMCISETNHLGSNKTPLCFSPQGKNQFSQWRIPV